MAVVLTENIVLNRTRSQDLHNVRKLNCWNFELTDVSIVRKMPCVQVLSLSLNKIKTLADFAFCDALEELYLRNNEITDINELFYLSKLPNLKKLWLAENPCADFPNYRNTVLKALPDLEVLDNKPVDDQEIRLADELGDLIRDPEISEEKQNIKGQKDKNVVEEELNDDTFYDNDETLEENVSEITSNISYGNDCSTTYSTPFKNLHGTKENQHVFSNTKINKKVTRNGSVDMPYNNGEQFLNKRNSAIYEQQNMNYDNNYSNQAQNSGKNNGQNRNSMINLETQNQVSGVCNSKIDNFEDYNNFINEFRSKHFNSNNSISTCNSNSSVSQRPKVMLSKGGKNRNANLLSAVLCLIKELDFASLEVVETAVHCRMEELEE